MKASNSVITKVSIQFNNESKPIESLSKRKSNKSTPSTKRRKPKYNKVVRGAKMSKELIEKLRPVFSTVNRARSIIEQLADPEIPLKVLRERVLIEMRLDNPPPIIKSLIHKEVYHAYNDMERGLMVDGSPTKSLSLSASEDSNALFTIMHSRSSIMFEDLELLLSFRKPLPNRKEGSLFHINVCVNDLMDMSYVYVNYIYIRKENKRRKRRS